MSEFHVVVAPVREIIKHPNANSLSIGKICGDYPVIFKTGEYAEGELAVHVPVDSIVPDTPEWAFLNGSRRIKAKRLRGIFSMGLLAKAKPEWAEGQNVQAELGIEKYEPTVQGHRFATGKLRPVPDVKWIPRYTDLESLRRFPNALTEGETVVIMEKIHGANGRWAYGEGEHHVGSHNLMRKLQPDDPWWRAYFESGLAEWCEEHPGLVVYGELYGKVQDLSYGEKDLGIKVFDIFDGTTGRWLSFYDLGRMVLTMPNSIHLAPLLYGGPWHPDLKSLAEGNSTVQGANHVREGFVVRPIKERSGHYGRVIFKYVGEGYLLRKGG